MTAPAKFDDVERQDNELRSRQSNPAPEPRINFVRRALGESLVLAATAALFGGFLGVCAAYVFGPSRTVVTFLAVAGTAILLWGTLAVQGWEIQTFDGVTLTERVNRWIFRFLYWIGTAILVMAAAWGIVA